MAVDFSDTRPVNTFVGLPDAPASRAFVGIDAVAELRRRIFEEYAPDFAVTRNVGPYTLSENLSLHPRVAGAFLRAVDGRAVTRLPGANFQLPRTTTPNGSILFGHGPEGDPPRRLTFSYEPLIEIGAAGDLQFDHAWPNELLGFQSKGYAFDLCGYRPDGSMALAVEAKTRQAEVDLLVEHVRFCGKQGLHGERECREGRKNSIRINHHRKYAGAIRFRPAVFWAIGPEGGRVFLFSYQAGGIVELEEVTPSALHYPLEVEMS